MHCLLELENSLTSEQKLSCRNMQLVSEVRSVMGGRVEASRYM